MYPIIFCSALSWLGIKCRFYIHMYLDIIRKQYAGKDCMAIKIDSFFYGMLTFPGVLHEQVQKGIGPLQNRYAI